MSKLIGRLLVVMAFGWAGGMSVAQAMPVTVGTRQWSQPIDFVNLTWNEISDVCSATGDCSANPLGALANMDSWTWASIAEVGALINEVGGIELLGPGPEMQTVGAASGSVFPLFVSAGFEPTLSASPWRFIAGWMRDEDRAVDGVRVADGMVVELYYGPGVFSNIDIVQAGLRTTYGTDYAISSIGGWFYREVEPPVTVPNPATLPLLGLGLASLGYSRRKRNLQS